MIKLFCLGLASLIVNIALLVLRALPVHGTGLILTVAVLALPMAIWTLALSGVFIECRRLRDEARMTCIRIWR